MAMNSPKDLKDTVEKLFPITAPGQSPAEEADFEDWQWDSGESD